MVNSMKNKMKAGNTLSFVLILLIIVSIISMALVYSISYTTQTRLDKSHANYDNIILQNKGYEVLNFYIDEINTSSSTLTLDTYTATFMTSYQTFLEDGKYRIKFESTPVDNTIKFKIGRSDDEDALLVEALYLYKSDNTILKYELKKWGMTKWT